MAITTYTVANNVRLSLNTSISDAATSLTLTDAVAPFNNPPAPIGGYPGVLTFTDSFGAPTKYEIITYTGVVDNMDGTRTLTGVTRNVESSGAKAWTAGAIAFQSVTAAGIIGLRTMAGQDSTDVEISGGSINGTVIGQSSPSVGTFSEVNSGTDVYADGFMRATVGYHFLSETDDGNSGAAKTLDWSTRHRRKLTISANTTLTFTAPVAPCSLILKVVTHVSSGATFTIAWPSSATVKWAGGVAPDHKTGNSKTHIYTFYFDGTVYWGSAMLDCA